MRHATIGTRMVIPRLAIGLLLILARELPADGYNLPERVKVLPVAFVPSDQATPSPADQALFLRHLAWTRKRFGELLNGDTFTMAETTVTVVRAARPLDFYRGRPQNGAPEMVVELLGHHKVSRFENPYVFCVMVANAGDGFPVGGGRPINGGLNSGGGAMFVSSFALRRNKHFQTTLQHELGHGFGLPHPDVYGYDLKTNPSIMSYSPANFSNGFQPSPTPGVLIPEDRRALAWNDRVFAKTTFDPELHVRPGYELSPKIVPLGPMELPGLPDFYPKVATDAGEAVRSRVGNVVSGAIKPSAGPGITYDAKNMWHSDRLPGKSATLTFTFPFAIELTALAIHSQHSGRDHAATAMRLDAVDGNAHRLVANQKLADVDAVVTFPNTSAQRWKLTLEPGKSRILVIRGIRFLNGDSDIVPHMVPYTPAK